MPHLTIIAASCPNKPNPGLVWEKECRTSRQMYQLLGMPGSLFKLVEAPVLGQSGADDITHISPTAMTHNAEEGAEAKVPRGNFPLTLPPGLVGPRCVSTVSVGDTRCQSIFDTGSQVTTISTPSIPSTWHPSLFNPSVICSRLKGLGVSRYHILAMLRSL